MMRYMAARLRGLDQGRKPDDPLRKDLNNMKRVLANITKKLNKTATTTTTKHEHNSKKSEGKTKGKSTSKVEVENEVSSNNLDPVWEESSKIQSSDTCDTKNIAPIRMKRENNNDKNNNINNY